MKYIFFVIIFSFFSFSINSYSQKFENGVYQFKNVEAAETGKAVDFTFEMNGKIVKFSEYTKGQVVFLNFWGTWCPPCRKEIPDIIEIAKELNNKDFIVIGVPSEKGNLASSVEKVEKFVETNKLNYINIVMEQKTQALKQGYMKAANNPLQYVPTTIIIDKKGNIHKVIVGMQSKEGFMAAIKEVL